MLTPNPTMKEVHDWLLELRSNKLDPKGDNLDKISLRDDHPNKEEVETLINNLLNEIAYVDSRFHEVCEEYC